MVEYGIRCGGIFKGVSYTDTDLGFAVRALVTYIPFT